MTGTHLPIKELLEGDKEHDCPGVGPENVCVHIASIADLPTRFGFFHIVAFWNHEDRKEHIALVRGDVTNADDVLVRLHSECLTGDALGSLRCDCRDQLEAALTALASEERGLLLYLRQEGRGIGLLNKLRAYELQESAGIDTVDANLELGFPADARDYGIGSQILSELGLTTIRVLTNNPRKLTGVAAYGLEVVEQVPIETAPNAENLGYLRAKRDRLGHRLHHQDLRFAEELEAE